MVHLKASTGCDKCRERRIKCDEAKPECNRCTKRGITCPGYRSFGGMVFVDVGKTFTTPKAKPVKRAESSTPATDTQIVLRANPIKQMVLNNPEQLAIQFFFENVVLSPDRDPLLSRGHFDSLLEMYCSAAPTSAVSLATSVMAGCVFQQFHEQRQEATWQIQNQSAAHTAISRAIIDPKESLKDETLMAIVLMDFAARLSSDAPYPTTEAHMAGALALANRRGDASFTSKASLNLLTAIRSNALLFSLWKGDEDGYKTLKRVPDVHPGHDSLAAALHYISVKAIVLDVDAGIASAAVARGEMELLASYWTDTASNVIAELDEWFEKVPLTWRLSVGHGPSKVSGRWCPDLPSMPVLYLIGQWHCIKLNLIKILSNFSPDMQLRRQVYAQGRIVFENLRSLFPHFEADQMIIYDKKPLITDFMHHAASYAAPVTPARMSRYKATAPSGHHYLLNLIRWVLTDVQMPDWCLQPMAEWESVKLFLLDERDRIMEALESQARLSRLAQLF